MRERVFNLFLFVDSGVIRQLGATAHRCGGSDEDKIRFLQGKVHDDYRVCKRYPVPPGCVRVAPEGARRGEITYEGFLALQRLGRHMDFFEPVMEDLGAPQQPLLVVTPIVDGAPRIEGVTDLTPEMNPRRWE